MSTALRQREPCTAHSAPFAPRDRVVSRVVSRAASRVESRVVSGEASSQLAFWRPSSCEQFSSSAAPLSALIRRVCQLCLEVVCRKLLRSFRTCRSTYLRVERQAGQSTFSMVIGRSRTRLPVA
jgi:hypothetical protein